MEHKFTYVSYGLFECSVKCGREMFWGRDELSNCCWRSYGSYICFVEIILLFAEPPAMHYFGVEGTLATRCPAYIKLRL